MKPNDEVAVTEQCGEDDDVIAMTPSVRDDRVIEQRN